MRITSDSYGTFFPDRICKNPRENFSMDFITDCGIAYAFNFVSRTKMIAKSATGQQTYKIPFWAEYHSYDEHMYGAFDYVRGKKYLTYYVTLMREAIFPESYANNFNIYQEMAF